MEFLVTRFYHMVHTGLRNFYSKTFPGLFQDFITKFKESISSGSHIVVSQYHIFSHARKQYIKWNLEKTNHFNYNEVLGTMNNDIPCST